MARFLPLPRHPFANSGFQMLFGGLALLAVGGARGEWAGFALADVSARSWFGFLWLIFAVAAGAFILLGARFLRRLQTGYAVNYALTMLVGAVVLVAFLLAR